MHTLTCWTRETPVERTDRFKDWYKTYTEYEGAPTTVTVHKVYENYGGPEEGGWTFQSGCPVETICIFSEAQALRVLHELHEKYDTEDYDDGTYDICLAQSYADFYPAVRPHYE